MAVAFILMILLLLLFLIAPSCAKQRAKAWRGTSFAHRGIHGNGISENSLPAFERACRLGFGIELDVQLTRDGQPVVFHDETLWRMTGDKRRVDSLSYAELRRLSLPDGSRIPKFEDALRCVNGRVPLLVELKNGRSNAELCRKTVELLRAYRGPYLIESFNPLILRWFRKNAPDILRGQLVGALQAYLGQFGGLAAFLLSNLVLNFLARPDFIAYNVNANAFFTPRVQRALFCIPMAAWTITSPEAYAEARARGEMPIFEGFIPQK